MNNNKLIKLAIIMLGFIPFITGNLVAFFSIRIDSFPYTVVSVLFLLMWFTISRISAKYTKNSLETAILINLIPFIILLINFYQVFILKSWSLSHHFQFYYLTALSLSSHLAKLVPFLIDFSFISMVFSFILMFTISLISNKPY